MIGDDNRFESDPAEALDGEPAGLPDAWEVGTPDPEAPAEVRRLVELEREHEEHGRGWATSGQDEVLVELDTRMRENLVVRDAAGVIQAWGSVHDRAGGRMVLGHVIARDLSKRDADACSAVIVDWAVQQAHAVGAARGVEVQQIDTGAYADDERQRRLLSSGGFRKVRTWWQMKRRVTSDERDLVSSPDAWEAGGVRFRVVRRGPDGLPDVTDLQEVHDVLESAFTDHFNSHRETFWEFIHRLREDPGHAWDHWWLAEACRSSSEACRSTSEPCRSSSEACRSSSSRGTSERIETPDETPLGTLVGSTTTDKDGHEASYVEYLGVLDSARGRGVAKGLLHTAIADAALRGRPSIGLEVDADSPTGAHELYAAMGWTTSYVTESWHRDVAVLA